MGILLHELEIQIPIDQGKEANHSNTEIHTPLDTKISPFSGTPLAEYGGHLGTGVLQVPVRVGTSGFHWSMETGTERILQFLQENTVLWSYPLQIRCAYDIYQVCSS